MLLALDVGNTHITIGVYRDSVLQCISRISTALDQTDDEYAIALLNVLSLRGLRPEGISGAVMSSVVPQVTDNLRLALRNVIRCEPLVISPGVKTGLNIRIENPAVLGTDLVCGAVATLRKYSRPAVFIDLGTATKICALDRTGAFVGCSICPGVGISVDALALRAAQLPHIELRTDGPLIGTNTVDSMRSGVVFGTAAMLDGMVARYRDALGQDTVVVATGGYAQTITPYCRVEMIVDRQLVLDGLCAIYQKNRK